MKTDTYTKLILTIIAIALIALFFKKSDVVSSANAAIVNGKNYALVPTNSDGTIDVNIKDIDYGIINPLPVKVQQ